MLEEISMAYAATPAAPKTRPSTVSIAVWLLYLYAALQVVGVIVAVATLGRMQEAFKLAFKETPNADQAGTIGAVIAVFYAIFGILFAAGFVVLAILDGKGKNPARIITWVLGGIAVCCGGYGLISTAAGASMNFGNSGGSNGPTATEMQRILKDTLPSWYYPTLTALGIIELLAIIVAVVLLAMPASNQFFRKQPEPTWQPPMPPPASQ
jgi:hypothetical protein